MATVGTVASVAAWRVAVTAVALAMVGGVVITNVPGNSLVNWRQHPVPGRVFAHTPIILLLLALHPFIVEGLRRAAGIPARRFAAGFGAVLIGSAVAMVLLTVAAPGTMENLLTREWGLLEPLHLAMYAVSVMACREAARVAGPRHPRRVVYRTITAVLAVMMLEEIDYLGIGGNVVEWFGAPRARIRGVYVGSLHDLLGLAEHHGATTLGLLIAVVLAGVAYLVWRSPALLAELGSATSLPLIVTVVFMALAQADDLFGFPSIKLAPRGPEMEYEEPLELFALQGLLASLVLKLRRELRRPRAAAP
jgi:hypothetical protein